MDPNATLQELRDLVKTMLGDRTVAMKDLPALLEQHRHAAELFEALDNWLGKGGFPPTAWKPPATLVTQESDNQEAVRRRNQEFTTWRERVAEELPSLAQRVFALREKPYMGSGFHWGLEKSLGGVLQGVNDYDDERYYYSADSGLRQATLKVCFESLGRTIQLAEESAKRLAWQRQGILAQPAPSAEAEVASPGPFVPWFNLDEEGFITEAGIDTKDRWAGIAEFKVLTETVIYYDSNKEKFNALVRADTCLMAASRQMRDALRAVERFLGRISDRVDVEPVYRVVTEALTAAHVPPVTHPNEEQPT